MLLLSADEDCLLLKFRSDITFIDCALEIIRNLLEYAGIEDTTNLLLVSRELLKNAVVHGNQNNVSKEVIFRMTRLGQERFEVEIEDGGKGVNQHDLEVGREGRGNLPGAGRHGFAIIANLSEKIVFNEKGNKVTVVLRA